MNCKGISKGEDVGEGDLLPSFDSDISRLKINTPFQLLNVTSQAYVRF